MKINIDWKKVADGFGLSESLTKELFSDGRRIGLILESIICENMKADKAESERMPYDIIDSDNKKAEIRTITKKGISFRPSNQTGAGRKFNEEKFYDKLNVVDYFLLADINNIEDIKLYKISTDKVGKLYKNGFLGKNASIGSSKKRRLELLNETEEL